MQRKAETQTDAERRRRRNRRRRGASRRDASATVDPAQLLTMHFTFLLFVPQARRHGATTKQSYLSSPPFGEGLFSASKQTVSNGLLIVDESKQQVHARGPEA